MDFLELVDLKKDFYDIRIIPYIVLQFRLLFYH